MIQERENPRQNRVLLVATPEESGRLVSLLKRSEGSSRTPGDYIELTALPSRETDGAHPESSEADLECSGTVQRIQFSYVDERWGVSDAARSLEAGVEGIVSFTL